jgi:hypothetical protein
VNYVIEQVQNVLVGNINIDHDLLVVEFVEKEDGKLTLSNRIEIYDEKHTLSYTYNVRLMDFIDIEDSQLLVTTDSEQIEVVSHSSILLTTTNQAIDVVIALNTDYDFSPGEELTFTLTFGLENYSPTIQQEPEPPAEPVFYNMFYTEQGSNLSFVDGHLTFNLVTIDTSGLFIPSGNTQYVRFSGDTGQLQITLKPMTTGRTLIIELNGDQIVNTVIQNTERIIFNINIEEDLSVLEIKFSGLSNGKLYVESIIYTPE